ncbi:MAG: nitroreductase family protein [bacterium]|nr:nitroreductase family protein [bacterium]
MSNIIIDNEKCTRCGLCCRDCVSFVLKNDGGVIKEVNDHCIRCGHCVAICPQGAVSFKMNKMPFEDMADIEVCGDWRLDPDKFLKACKSGRSIRNYQNVPVEEEKIRKIIEAGRYTPTACNYQDVSYIVLRDQIGAVQAAAMRTFRKLAQIAAFVGRYVKLPFDFSKFVDVPDDFMFKKAPVAILTVSKNTIDASLAAANMQRMAESLGLGVLHVGFFTIMATVNPKLKKLVGLKYTDKIVNCLCIGYPGVTYQRTAPRRPASIDWK